MPPIKKVCAKILGGATGNSKVCTFLLPNFLQLALSSCTLPEASVSLHTIAKGSGQHVTFTTFIFTFVKHLPTQSASTVWWWLKNWRYNFEHSHHTVCIYLDRSKRATGHQLLLTKRYHVRRVELVYSVSSHLEDASSDNSHLIHPRPFWCNFLFMVFFYSVEIIQIAPGSKATTHFVYKLFTHISKIVYPFRLILAI